MRSLIPLLRNYTFRERVAVALSTEIKGAESLCVDVCTYVSALLILPSPDSMATVTEYL